MPVLGDIIISHTYTHRHEGEDKQSRTLSRLPNSKNPANLTIIAKIRDRTDNPIIKLHWLPNLLIRGSALAIIRLRLLISKNISI